jgi:hypothetical protein
MESWEYRWRKCKENLRGQGGQIWQAKCYGCSNNLKELSIVDSID